MNAEERSRTKRSIGSVRDDMGAIVGEILCGSVAICDQVDRTDRDVARRFRYRRLMLRVQIQ